MEGQLEVGEPFALIIAQAKGRAVAIKVLIVRLVLIQMGLLSVTMVGGIQLSSTLVIVSLT